jgi:tRNA(adenine34) deaminase
MSLWEYGYCGNGVNCSKLLAMANRAVRSDRMATINDMDLRLLRFAIEVARRARAAGNHPFGAVLADEQGNVLIEAENTVITDNDCTGHAELNLMRMASQQYPFETLSRCTLYSSTEPCPMCAGAIFWGGVGRVVYALSEDGLYAMTGDSPHKLPVGCREILAHGAHPIEVLGPALEDEAQQVHRGFWE